MTIPISKYSSSNEKMHTFTCLTEVIRLEQLIRIEKTPRNPPYDFKIPNLPEWTNEDLEFEGKIVNLKKLSCNCDDCKNNEKLYLKNDLRLICKHIYNKIISEEKYSNLFDDLGLLLIKSILNDHEKMLIVSGNNDNSSTFYIGGNCNLNSYNIYVETDDKWNIYNYSTDEKKWSENNVPNNSKIILETLKRNEFIFDKYLREES